MEIVDDVAISNILPSFGLNGSTFRAERIGTGHIHQTYQLIGPKRFILQRINKSVFQQPNVIASNLREAAKYLNQYFPDYPFLRSIPSRDGEEMAYDVNGFPWRIFPYIENSFTVDSVATAEEAFSAASEFGRLTRYLDNIDVSKFKETIPQFHDLSLRYQQFEIALKDATTERRETAIDAISACQQARPLVDEYNQLISTGALRSRITHNDTKINNILFDAITRKAVCVIDLDTLMPGYFIYDLGDMVRTFTPSVSEEEKDVSKIRFRKEMYDALLKGYRSQMEEVMSPGEIQSIPFAGKMMTYIMALRFLADFLRGDTYYNTTYSGQNLVRARNQLALLDKLMGF